jgi:hypothetical protein
MGTKYGIGEKFGKAICSLFFGVLIYGNCVLSVVKQNNSGFIAGLAHKPVNS